MPQARSKNGPKRSDGCSVSLGVSFVKLDDKKYVLSDP